MADGERVCVYRGITPGAQGSPCDAGGDCRAGICHDDARICVEACRRDSDCADGFECASYGGEEVCAVPAEGSCAVQGEGASGWPLPVLIALLLSVRRRRDWRREGAIRCA